MTEVVNSFVVGHWAVARKMVDRHVSRQKQMWFQWRVKKETNSQRKFMSTFYRCFLRKGISSLTLAVEMVKKKRKKKSFCCVQPQYTTENCLLNAHSLIWHQTQGNSDKNFHEIVLFKEAEYWSRVFHIETYNNHEFFYYLASTLLRRSKIGVYHFFHFQETDCWLD